MNGFGFRKNTVFEWCGVRFKIERMHENGDVLLERLSDGTNVVETRDHLLAEYRDGNISGGMSEHALKPDAQGVFSRPLDELPDMVQRETARRRRYLEIIFTKGRAVFTKKCMAPLIRLAAKEIGDTRPPSVTSIYRWYRRFVRSRDTRALIPRFDRRGARTLKQSDKVLQLANDAINEAFQASPHANGPSIYTRLVAKVQRENQFLSSEDQLSTPSIRTVYRMLHRIESYDYALLKDGKAAADKKFALAKYPTITTQILERVEIDHTPLDLFLIDEKSKLPLGRPTLTVAIDHFSRMMLGFYLSFGGPSVAAVMGVLRHAILPKQITTGPLTELMVEYAWPCYGVPDLIVVDNGLEFYASALDSVALDLGLKIHFCPKYQPRFKGTVERYLKTINYSFAHQLPGTSLARWHLRGDYDPTKHAVLTLAEFNQIFQKWILDVYSQTVHRGTHETPWTRWHAGMKQRAPELPESVHVLRQRIGQVDERTLRHDGILLHGIRYNGDELGAILNKHGPGTKVRVLFDSEDLGSIQVWGPDSEEPVRVLALNQEYAKGLTSLQNEMIREVLREKGASQTNPVALQQAKQDIIDTVESLMDSRKQKDRRRAATIRGISSSKFDAPALESRNKNQPQQRVRAKPQRDVQQPQHALDRTDAPPSVKYVLFRPKQEGASGGAS